MTGAGTPLPDQSPSSRDGVEASLASTRVTSANRQEYLIRTRTGDEGKEPTRQMHRQLQQTAGGLDSETTRGTEEGQRTRRNTRVTTEYQQNYSTSQPHRRRGRGKCPAGGRRQHNRDHDQPARELKPTPTRDTEEGDGPGETQERQERYPPKHTSIPK